MLSGGYFEKDSVVTDFIVFVTNEETDGSGSHHLQTFQENMRVIYGNCCCSGEPINLTSCEIGHRGNVYEGYNSWGFWTWF